MNIDTKSMHVTPVGGNIFADLGFEPKEAARMLAETDQVISERQAIKEALMNELTGWIQVKKLKQAEAAQILGVTRPRVSDIINKKSIKFTIDSLVDMLARTGKRVQLSVQ